MFARKKRKPISVNNVSVDLNQIIEELGKQRAYSTYTEATTDFIEGGMFSDSNVTNGYSDSDIEEMLANPESNLEKISNFLHYLYISNGDVYQLYTIFRALPSLNYQIGAFDNSTKKYEESISIVNKALHKVRCEELTRDLIGQACLDGGVVAMWCGNKKNVFCYVFDNLEYVFPKYRLNGDWVCVLDLAWLDDMKEEERMALFTNLAPYVTESMYNRYQGDVSNVENKYIELPQDRTQYIRNADYLKRNQRIAMPLGTQALLDLNHKKKLTQLEDSVANKAIRQIAVLQLGSNEINKGYINLSKQARTKITQGVVNALRANTSTNSNQIPMAVLPEFCKLEFGKIDGVDALGSDKFDTVNKDIGMDTGLHTTKNMSTKASEFYLDLLYKRIGIILSQIEQLFEKMIKVVVSKREADNLFFKFDKTVPLTRQEEVEMLYKLEAQGYSVKAVIDRISGINFDDFLEQSLYEIEELKLRERIMPPLSTYTLAGEGNGLDSSDEEEIEEETSDSKEETSTQEEETSADDVDIEENGGDE